MQKVNRRINRLVACKCDLHGDVVTEYKIEDIEMVED